MTGQAAVRWLGGLAILAIAAAAYWVLRVDETVLAPTDLGRGDYRLVRMDGTPFTEASLRGAPSLVFFGFTHCPDVCPTTLGDLAGWQAEMGDAWAGLRVFFVSVDPERDSAEILTDYVGWLPGVQGVTGAREETDKALRAFRIFAARVPLEGDEYTMDHSSSILMFDARGRLAGTIAYQSPQDEAVGKIKVLLGG
ncbi:MAG: SCO family protein [Qingshengfaniella sp.]